MVAAILIAFRLIWGVIGGEHARFTDFLKPHQIAHHIGGLFSGKPQRSIGHNAAWRHRDYRVARTVGGIVYTGATMQGEAEGGLHETLANVLIGLIALHVIAVIGMSLLTKDNLIRAFITGTKRADLHPGVEDARPPAPLALPSRDRDRGDCVWSDGDCPPSIHPRCSCQYRRTRRQSEKGEHGDD